MNCILRNIIFLFISLLEMIAPLKSFSQKDSTYSFSASVLVIQPQVHVGKMLKIYRYFPKTDFVELNEVNIAFQTTGSKEWHQSYHYPQVGVSLIYGYLGNDGVLGRNISMIPNLGFNNRNGKRLWLQTRFGMGFSYFTKHYNIVDNPDNLIMGSSITNITFISCDVNYRLSSHFVFNLGGAFYHCSNGHYQLPNLGANMPCASIGISYFPVAKPALHHRESITMPKKKLLFNMNIGYGRHEFGSATKATGGPKYSVYQVALYVSKRWRKISNVHLGLFVTYYSDYYDYIVNQETFDKQQRLKASIVTVFIGHEYMIGHFGLVTQLGFNFYTPFLKEYRKEQSGERSILQIADILISDKIGLHYYPSNPYITTKNKIYFGIYLKANSGTADFAELAAGYTF